MSTAKKMSNPKKHFRRTVTFSTTSEETIDTSKSKNYKKQRKQHTITFTVQLSTSSSIRLSSEISSESDESFFDLVCPKAEPKPKAKPKAKPKHKHKPSSSSHSSSSSHKSFSRTQVCKRWLNTSSTDFNQHAFIFGTDIKMAFFNYPSFLCAKTNDSVVFHHGTHGEYRNPIFLFTQTVVAPKKSTFVTKLGERPVCSQIWNSASFSPDSRPSEAYSGYLFPRLLYPIDDFSSISATAENKISYKKHSTRTDYKLTNGKFHTGVQVKRLHNPDPTMLKIQTLLQKVDKSAIKANNGVLGDDKWHTHVLHILTKSSNVYTQITKYLNGHDIKGFSAIFVTVVTGENRSWIFNE